MNGNKNIIILSEKIGLYHVLTKCFAPKYRICRYGHDEWGRKSRELPVLQKDTILFVIETENETLDTLHQIKKIRLGAFAGLILVVSDAEDRERQIREKVSFIHAGADEYLAYPQTQEEILVSIEALVRRCEKKGFFSVKVGGSSISIIPQKREVLLEGKTIAFTKLEFKILKYLILHLNQVVPHKELYEAVWGKEYLKDDENIMVHIHRIRKKMGDDLGKPKYIQNIYGIGYLMEGE